MAGKTHHAKRLGHLPFEEQVVQRGNELARGEIAARAKDHDRAGLIGLALVLQSRDAQQVGLVIIGLEYRNIGCRA
mgnify:CR=1 FL=1